MQMRSSGPKKVGLGLLGGKFYPRILVHLCAGDTYFALEQGHLAGQLFGKVSGFVLSMGRDFGFLSGAAVSCFGGGSGLMF